jgi:hypothetical protein
MLVVRRTSHSLEILRDTDTLMETERRGQIGPDSFVQYLNNNSLGQNLNLTLGQAELVTQLLFKCPRSPQ